jgi:hypothetical protein
VNPAFLSAALMWEPLREQQHRLQEQGLDEYEALQEAIDTVIQAQIIPRRFTSPLQHHAGNLGNATAPGADHRQAAPAVIGLIPDSGPPMIF